jgi:endoglucanase
MRTARIPKSLGALFCFSLVLPSVAQTAEAPTLNIKVDQVGYPTKSTKIALVSVPGERFLVKRVKDGSSVLEGALSAKMADKDTGDTVAAADFTAVNDPGDYYLEVPGVGRSWPFKIGSDIYIRTYYLGARAFYGQRCGTAVDLGPEFPGFKYPACHLHGEFHPSSGKRGRWDNLGGWHDAGDYGRYVVDSGITVGTLLWAWELYGDKLKAIPLNIPESGKGTPDLLAETRWNLEWMLGMQDADGGVFQKQTSEGFIGFVPPDKDKTISYVIGTGVKPYKGTCATADLAASAAIAARVYKPFDPAFAAKCLLAAEKAWKWAVANPDVAFKNPAGVMTGSYGDMECGDEMLWAAAELWRTTGQADYNDYFLGHWVKQRPRLAGLPTERGLEITPTWREETPLALWAYAMAVKGDKAVQTEIQKDTVTLAKAEAADILASPYRMGLTAKDYIWGSNGLLVSSAMRLLMADHFDPDPAFRQAALDDLHYLLGRNTFSLSYVTQVGANALKHPHHRPSGATDKPWPGLLSGGPNARREDPLLAKLAKDLPPAKVFLDSQGSWASNEIAINWQAAFVFLVAAQLP